MIFYDILCIYIYIHNYKYVKYVFIYAYIYIYIHDLIYVYRFFVCHGSPAGELTSCALDLFPQPWPILHHLKDSGATVGTRSYLHCTRCSWGILGLPPRIFGGLNLLSWQAIPPSCRSCSRSRC